MPRAHTPRGMTVLRVEDSDDVRQRASALAAEIRDDPGARIAFRCNEAHGWSRLLALVVTEIQGAVLVHVPAALDQSERVILEIAQALGGDVAKATDSALRAAPETPKAALDILDGALGERRLVIDGWDRLGFYVADAEIGVTLKERIHALRTWLARRGTLFALARGEAPKRTAQRRWLLPEDPPVVLRNGSEQPPGFWERFLPDARQYELALTLLTLSAPPHDDAIESATDHGLRARIVELLPDSARKLLAVLSIHARPLSENLLEPLVSSTAQLDFGTQIGLWRRMPSGLMVDSGWSRWWHSRLGVAGRRGVHRELAELFASQAKPDDTEAGRAGLSMLEAHRHYLGAGDAGKARVYARYGAALLVENARMCSREGRYEDAADLYARVVEAAESESLPIGKKLCAYARHYLHYNLAHADAEGLKATEQGYRKALEEWPENALFWSRLARVLFYDNRPAGALELIEEARRRVPDHPEKRTVLIARTVRGLLHGDRDLVLDAIRVWGDFQPDTSQAAEIEAQLTERLAAGWKVRHIHLDLEHPLYFTRPQELQVERVARGWLASAPLLGESATGTSPLEALRVLVERLRQQTERLIRAYTADLAPDERLGKQRLLGAIDVVASRVDAPAADTMWVFGELQREEDKLWLRTGGSYDLRFEVPPHIAGGMVVNDLPYFALVKTDGRVPTGPVERLEPGVRRSADEILEELRRRLNRAG